MVAAASAATACARSPVREARSTVAGPASIRRPASPIAVPPLAAASRAGPLVRHVRQARCAETARARSPVRACRSAVAACASTRSRAAPTAVPREHAVLVEAARACPALLATSAQTACAASPVPACRSTAGGRASIRRRVARTAERPWGVALPAAARGRPARTETCAATGAVRSLVPVRRSTVGARASIPRRVVPTAVRAGRAKSPAAPLARRARTATCVAAGVARSPARARRSTAEACASTGSRAPPTVVRPRAAAARWAEARVWRAVPEPFARRAAAWRAALRRSSGVAAHASTHASIPVIAAAAMRVLPWRMPSTTASPRHVGLPPAMPTSPTATAFPVTVAR